MALDIDAFLRVHHSNWERLDELASQSRLSAAETDEFLGLYRQASAHLSMLQAAEADSPAAADLSARIGRARARLTSGGTNVLSSMATFFVYTLPVALYQLRWLTLVVAAAWISLAVLIGTFVASHEQIDTIMPAELRQSHAQQEFTDYYYQHPNVEFASQVWTNNLWVAAQCIAFGLTGVFPLLVLGLNATNVGIVGGVMYEQQAAEQFWLYLLPHGILELTAVFIAAAAGLRIFFAWVAPGRQRRISALVTQMQRLMSVVLGLVLVLLVSGLIEGFVTPSQLPYWMRIGIGVLAWVCLWAYVLILGGQAHRAGLRGELGQYDAGRHELTV